MLKFFKSLFVMKNSRQTRLEKFLVSKGCTDNFCIDYWVREFERNDRFY